MSKKTPIDYIELDESADLHAFAVRDMEDGAERAVRRLHESVRAGGDGINLGAAAAAAALVDSPLGDGLEGLALSPHRPVGLESAATVEYLDLLHAVEEGMKYLTGPTGSIRDPDGALHGDFVPTFIGRLEELERRLKRRVAKAEHYVEERGGRVEVLRAAAEGGSKPGLSLAALRRALI